MYFTPDLLAKSDGGDMPLMPDRGTKFFLRKAGGDEGASFPDGFYREAGTSGR